METKKKKQIAILGSTGSIGTQTLQVVEEHPECFEVYAITANTRVDELIAQARKFMPEAVVIADETKYLRSGPYCNNLEKPNKIEPYRTCLSFYGNKRDRKNFCGKDFCKIRKL